MSAPQALPVDDYGELAKPQQLVRDVTDDAGAGRRLRQPPRHLHNITAPISGTLTVPSVFAEQCPETAG